MDSEELYNDIVAFLYSKNIEVRAEADDMLADFCRVQCEEEEAEDVGDFLKVDLL